MGNDIHPHTPLNIMGREAIIGFQKADYVSDTVLAAIRLAEHTVAGELENRFLPDFHDNRFRRERHGTQSRYDDEADDREFYRAPHESLFS
ncbi:hypothetical protein IB60_10935 [Brucella abortus LMN1]|nr:hypothetical protein IB60_10935 [Brucella abortus LMN1]